MFVRRIARSFALFAFAASSVTAATPQAAVAGDCPGMLDYEYSSGECQDKTGDTYDTMIQMYNDSYHQQQGMLDRGRSVFNNGFGINTGRAPRITEPSPGLKRHGLVAFYASNEAVGCHRSIRRPPRCTYRRRAP